MIGHNVDDWDDSVILKVFHDSLKKHVTKNKEEVSPSAPSSQPQTATETATPSEAPSSSTPLTGAARTPVDTKAKASGEKRKRDSEKKAAAPKAVGFAAALENYVAARNKGFSQTPKSTATNKSAPSSHNKPSPAVDESAGKKVTFDVGDDAERDADTAAHTNDNISSIPPPFDQSTAVDGSSGEATYDQSAWHQHYQSIPALPAAGNVITSSMIDDAMQAMLMAWYQSGYATGRYQTLCELSGRFPQTQEQPK